MPVLLYTIYVRFPFDLFCLGFSDLLIRACVCRLVYIISVVFVELLVLSIRDPRWAARQVKQKRREPRGEARLALGSRLGCPAGLAASTRRGRPRDAAVGVRRRTPRIGTASKASSSQASWGKPPGPGAP